MLAGRCEQGHWSKQSVAGRLPGTRSIHGPSFGLSARGRPHLPSLPEGISATFPEPFGEDARNVPQFPSDRPLGSQGFPRRGARRIPETGEAQASAHGSNHGSRAAVLRRSEGTCFSSGERRRSRRVPRCSRPPVCRRRLRNNAFRSVSSDEDGGNRANIAASGASNRTLRDPPRASLASETIGPSALGERGNQPERIRRARQSTRASSASEAIREESPLWPGFQALPGVAQAGKSPPSRPPAC